MKKIITAIMLSLLSLGAFAQEVADPTKLDENKFFVSVYDLEDNETKEIEERIFLYQGTITDLSSDVLQKAVEEYPDVKKIALNSLGGLASEAGELGRILSDNRISVWVPKGRVCLSACANAFIGGTDYDVDGLLGFHSAWVPGTELEKLSGDQLNTMMGSSQYRGVYDAYYWLANGFSISLPAYINGGTSPTRFLIFTSEDELNKFYIRDDENADNNLLLNYLAPVKDYEPVIWSAEDMSPYITDQLEWLKENSTTTAVLVEVIYSPMPEETEEDSVDG